MLAILRIFFDKVLLYLSLNNKATKDQLAATQALNHNIDFYVNVYLPNNGNLLTANGQWLTDNNENYLTF